MLSTDSTKTRSLDLHEVARVQPGYLSRSRVRSTPNGTHLLLQGRDISADGAVQLDAAARFWPERNPKLYQVSQGDILLIARGQVHPAHLITIDLSNTLASSVFYIIRPHTELVLPGYLAWWLNHPQVQMQVNKCSQGTGIGLIDRKTIEGLPVPVPPLDVQCKIENAITLWREQKSIQARLDKKREQLIQATCRQAVWQ